MTQLTDKVYAVEVPPGNYGEGLIIEVDGKYYLNLIDDNGEMLASTKPLPPGTWRFLFTTKTATEEDARKVVERTHAGGFGRSGEEFKNYIKESPVCYSAIESLRSLLRSKALDPDKNFAIIEKLK